MLLPIEMASLLWMALKFVAADVVIMPLLRISEFIISFSVQLRTVLIVSRRLLSPMESVERMNSSK
jgi:hypothetical protein